MESIIIKILAVISNHYPIGAGTALNIYVVRRRHKKKNIEHNYKDDLELGMISFCMSLLAVAFVIGFYEYRGLEPKISVVIAAGGITAGIGYSGLVFIVDKIDGWSERIFQTGLDKISGKDK